MTSVEVLEEMGEETDGAVESVSKLQSKIKALSGVNILTDSGAYKSTYEILKEIGAVWEDMSDIDQAALLELMAGKNRSNVLASIFGNMEDLEGAYEDAMNAEGSAVEENEKYLDSIQGRIDVFTTEVQTMWMNVIDTDVVKGIVDIGTALIKVLDTINPFVAAIGGILFYFTAIKKNSPVAIFKDLSKNATSFSKAVSGIKAIQTLNGADTSIPAINQEEFNKQNLANYAKLVKGLSADKQYLALTTAGLNDEMAREAMQMNGLSKEQTAQAVATAALTSKKEAATKITIAQISASLQEQGVSLTTKAAKWLEGEAIEDLTEKKINDAVATGTLTANEGAAIIATLGLGSAAKVAGTGFKALGTAIKTAFQSNSIGFVLTAITTVITLVGPIISKFVKSTEEKIQELEESINSLVETAKTAQSEFQSLKTSADETIPRFVELAKGVDSLGNNISLTDEEYEEFIDLNNKIADMFPEINLGMDENGNAMLNLSYSANTLEDSLYSLLEAQRQVANQEIADTMPDLVEDIKGRDELYDKEAEKLEKQQQRMKEAYQKYLDYLSGEKYQYHGPSISEQGSDQDLLQYYSDMGFRGKLKSMSSAGSATWEVNFEGADPDEVARNYENMMAGMAKKIETVNAKQKSLWSNLNPVISAWLSTDYSYNTLSDELQNAVNLAIGNIDFAALGKTTDEDIKKYIQESVVDPISDMSEQGKSALNSIFQMDDDKSYMLYLADYKKHLGVLTAELGEETATAITSGIAGDVKGIEEAYAKVKDIVSDEYDYLIDSMSVSDIKIAYTIDAASGSMTIAELESKILEMKTVPFEISDYEKDIDSIQESISEYQSALQSLNEGTFTYSDFIDLTQKFPELAEGVDTSTKSFKGLERNLKKAIKAAPEELVDELKDLREQLVATGNDTEALDQLIYSMENMPTDAIEETTGKYSTLTDEINAAKKAQNELQEAMNENPNEGYETRGEALEYMKDKMSRGEIGSESEIWSIAEKYGFTYDAEKSINENADALARFIAIRERWYKQDDDGNYIFGGTENFIETVEGVVAKSTELQDLMTWSYDEETGAFNFNFDNKNFSEIVRILGETEELAGLTKEEFSDMLKQIAQYFGLSWGDADDVSHKIDEIAKSSGSSTEKISEMTGEVEAYLAVLGKDIDLDNLTEESIDNLSDGDEAIENLLEKYITLRDYVANNPLSINLDDDYETIVNILVEAGLKVEETKDAFGNTQLEFDIVDVETLLREKGYTSESIMAIIEKLFGGTPEYTNLIEARQQVENIKIVSDDARKALELLGIQYHVTGNSQGAVLIIDSNFEEKLKELHYTDEEIAEFKQRWEANGIYIETTINENGIDESKDTLNEIPENVQTTLTLNAEEFSADLEAQTKALDNFAKTRTATIVIDKVTREVTVKSTTDESTPVKSNSNSRQNMIEVNGTAHAQGSWGAEESGTALMAELGPELIVDPKTGTWRTVGDNGAEFTQVKRGQIIFNH